MRAHLSKARRVLLSFSLLTVVFTATLGGLGYVVVETRTLARENATATVALCALRADLAGRLANSAALLEEFPGPMIFGIPRGIIIQSRDSQQQTIAALSGLDCPQ